MTAFLWYIRLGNSHCRRRASQEGIDATYHTHGDYCFASMVKHAPSEWQHFYRFDDVMHAIDRANAAVRAI